MAESFSSPAEVRAATLADLPALLEWRMRVLAEVFPAAPGEDRAALRAANEAYYRLALADGSHTACFARDPATGRIVGCGGICYQREMPSPDNPPGTNGYLMNIYVLPPLRGCGIGRAIVAWLLADARRRGTGKIYLEASLAGHPLYTSLGFKDMPDYMKLGQPLVPAGEKS